MRKVYLILALFAFLLGFCASSTAQISHGGTPPSFQYRDALPDNYMEVSVTPINVAAVRAEDSLRPGPLWAGRSIPVNYTLENSGTWTTLPDGNKVWQLKITSVGAKALGVAYTSFTSRKAENCFYTTPLKRR